MQQKVAEFAANLIMAGVNREKVAEMGYYYAFSLRTNELKASELIRDAMPEADKIHDERCMVKPIAPVAQMHVDSEAMKRALGIRKSEDKP